MKKIKTIEGQINIFSFLSDPVKFHNADWLKAHGYKIIYDEHPPKPGVYEWVDIEEPKKSKLLEYTESGSIHLGRLAMGKFRPCWWREVTEDEK